MQPNETPDQQPPNQPPQDVGATPPQETPPQPAPQPVEPTPTSAPAVPASEPVAPTPEQTPASPVNEQPADAPQPAPAPVPTPAPAPQPTAQSPFMAEPTNVGSMPGGEYKPKANGGLLKKILLAVGALIVLGLLAAAFYFLVYVPNLSKVSEADLIDGNLDGTALLYPKQWKEFKSGANSYYGNGLSTENVDGSDDKKSTAGIVALKAGYVAPNVTSATDTQKSQFRDEVLKSVTPSVIEESFNSNSGDCKGYKDTSVEKYETESDKTVGLLKFSSHCMVGDQEARVDGTAILGDDGYMRMVSIFAIDNVWQQNEAVFNKMIDSAKQAS